MTTYYFKLEGRGTGRSDMKHPFGFFVHCLIASSSERDARNAVSQCMNDNNLSIKAVLFSGPFDSFVWDDAKLKSELNQLSASAAEKPDQVFCSEFHSWVLEES